MRAPVPQPACPKPSHVLVVDYDDELSERLRHAPQSFPMSVSFAQSVRQAEAALTQEKVDLVLLNPDLHDAEGWAFLESLHRQPPETRIPVLVISSQADQEKQTASFDLGAEDFLIKSCDLAELRARLRRSLRQKQFRDEWVRKTQDLEHARIEADNTARAKADFLASMSHEIRTPMNGVIAMTGLLLHTDLSPEQQDFVETIRASGEALLTIINDILHLSKIEAGKMELERHPYNLRSCIEEALDMLASKASEKSLDLLYRIHEPTPSVIVGDRARLQQVLVNLISNAVKFTSHGEILLEIRSHFLTPMADAAAGSNESVAEITFSVRDTGIGISPERLACLFEPYTQADGSITKNFGGTGLGLAISKGLVDLMGGTIGAQSKPGKGSTFHFTIPFPCGAAPDTTFTKTPVEQLQGLRVLILDDNDNSRLLLSQQLERWGLEPVAYGQPEAALMACREMRPWDAVIIDTGMPETDTSRLIRDMRAEHPGGPLPMLLISGVGKRPEMASLLAEPQTAQVGKPVKPEALQDALLQVLSRPPRESKARTPRSDKLDEGLATRLPLRILLADDNVINQKVASRLLRQLGYRADLVKTGQEAINALERQPYDIIFMDVQMPEMDGLEATRQIRLRQADPSAHPHFQRSITIIAMTANAMVGDREKCVASGMDDYLPKPVRPEALQKILECYGAQSSGLESPPDETSPESGPTPRDPSAAPHAIPLPVWKNGNASVNLERLEEFSGGSQAHLKEIVQLFLQQTTEQLEEMGQAIRSGAAEQVATVAHSCAGASATCGIVALASLMRQLEHSGKSGDFATVSRLFEEAVQQFDWIKKFLENRLDQRPSSTDNRIAL